MGVIEEIIKVQSNTASIRLDDEIIKAINHHGYKIDKYSYADFLRYNDCEVLRVDDISTLSINGKNICLWTDWKIEPYDFKKEVKVNMYFKFKIL